VIRTPMKIESTAGTQYFNKLTEEPLKKARELLENCKSVIYEETHQGILLLDKTQESIIATALAEYEEKGRQYKRHNTKFWEEAEKEKKK
jgi:C4-type Zn-finger protein